VFSTVNLIAAVAAVWTLIGIAGFRYWWDREWGQGDAFAFNSSFIVIAIGFVLGPIAWLAGWYIHRH
jgi:hypothetical protein